MMQMRHIIKIVRLLKNNYHIILAFATLLFIIIAFFLSHFNLKDAKKNSKYTVAYITSDWHQKNNNGVGTDFSYYIDGKRIDRTCASSLKKGTKYILLYDSIHPKNYIMLYNHKLPNNIKAPSNGWKFKDLPIKIDSNELKAYFKELDIP
ncbi:hypothetical protein ATE47_09415 [Chryseobacterium sp. IHB B 17019]|jgi:hypothetical protein|nr:hypothetical protein ATE47_09415 [Chryseobacterium sp. IHB B 17019]